MTLIAVGSVECQGLKRLEWVQDIIRTKMDQRIEMELAEDMGLRVGGFFFFLRWTKSQCTCMVAGMTSREKTDDAKKEGVDKA